MISLGYVEYDSADSGAGCIEILSESDEMYIRIHKLDPEAKSHRPKEKRDPEQWKVLTLSNRNLMVLDARDSREVRQ